MMTIEDVSAMHVSMHGYAYLFCSRACTEAHELAQLDGSAPTIDVLRAHKYFVFQTHCLVQLVLLHTCSIHMYSARTYICIKYIMCICVHMHVHMPVDVADIHSSTCTIVEHMQH